MRKLIALFLTVLMLTPFVGTVSAAENPQPVFSIDLVIKVGPTVIDNSTVWLGTFRMYVVLKDPAQREYFESLARENRTQAEEEFRSFVESLVYGNLRDNLEKRFEEAGLNSTVYLPSGGPVKVLDNWSAKVTFVVSNFLVGDDKVLRCPVSGPMKFVYRGRVFDYTWDRLTVILPKDYEIKNLAPAPEDVSNNVAIWENGNFIPIIELYTPASSYIRFLNSTSKEISLQFDPVQEYVQFNATFTGAKATQFIISQLMTSFKATMNILSIDAKEANDSLVIIGVARPDVSYQETSSERIWKAVVKLPGRFDRISVVGGTYTLAPDNTVIITVKEKKSVPYWWAIVPVLVVVGLYLVLRARRGSREGEEVTEEPEIEENTEEQSAGGE